MKGGGGGGRNGRGEGGSPSSGGGGRTSAHVWCAGGIRGGTIAADCLSTICQLKQYRKNLPLAAADVSKHELDDHQRIGGLPMVEERVCRRDGMDGADPDVVRTKKG
jgi:hypothetical protein